MTFPERSGFIRLEMKKFGKYFINGKTIFKRFAFFAGLTVLVATGILSLSPTQLLAQTGSTLWNVERDGSNNLNFYLTNNGVNQTTAMTITAAGATQFPAIANAGPYTNDWFRINGTANGVFWTNFGGGWTMTDTTWLRAYGGKNILAPKLCDESGPTYCVDPASSSTFNALTMSGRLYTNEWLQLNGPQGTGIYSANNGVQTYLYPNNGTYGAWRMSGNRNGWGGLEFDAPTTPASNVTLMVGNNTQAPANITTGMHLNGSGWLWSFNGSALTASSLTDKENGGYYMDPAGSSNLNAATFASGPYTNDWFRANGSNGLYFQSYGGGWHMIDSTYIRSYGNKPILVPLMYDQDNPGYYVDPHATSNVNQFNANYIYTNVNGSYFPHPNGSNYFRGQTFAFNGTWYDDNNTGYYVDPNNVTILNDVRANVFYDQSNTGYYMIPRSTSRVNTIYSDRLGVRVQPGADLHIKQTDQSQGGAGGIRLERSDNGTFARIFEGGDNALYFFTNSNNQFCYLRTDAAWICQSDGRYKENIKPLSSGALDVINLLKPSTFNYKVGGKFAAGFIAQEVKEVIPNAVDQSAADGTLGIADAHFTPYMVKAIQELDIKAKEQKSDIQQLKSEVAELKKQIEELKKNN